MGIQSTYVLPVKDHLNVLTCTLCSNLVSLDGYVTTPCSHCFCRDCLDNWVETLPRKTKQSGCPTCDVSITSEQIDGVLKLQVSPLHYAQPLLHRMLSQVKVLCPCRHDSSICYWTGDYSRLQQHLDTEHNMQTTEEVPPNFSIGLRSTWEQQNGTDADDKDFETQSEHVRKSPTTYDVEKQTVELHNQACSGKEAELHRSPVRRRRSLSAPGIASTQGARSEKALPSIEQRNYADSTRNLLDPALARMEQDANAAFKEGRHEMALDLYTRAINSLCSDSSPSGSNMAMKARLYGNRAAAFLKQKLMRECIEDCDRALSINKQSNRAFSRKASALIATGNFREACVTLSDGLKNNPNNAGLKEELAFCQKLESIFSRIQLMIDAKEYQEANRLLSKAPSSSRLVLLLQCKVDLGLGNATKVIKSLKFKTTTEEMKDVDIASLLAEAHFQNGDLYQAIHQVRNVPEGLAGHRAQEGTNLQTYQDVQSWILSGQSAMREKKIEVAVRSFSNAIRSCADRLPPNCKMLQVLFLLRSRAYLSAQELFKCLEDTMNVISFNKSSVKAWVIRVKALQALQRYDLIPQELRDVVNRLNNSFLNEAYQYALGVPSKDDTNECQLEQKNPVLPGFENRTRAQVKNGKTSHERSDLKDIAKDEKTMKLLTHELSISCENKPKQRSQHDSILVFKSNAVPAKEKEKVQPSKTKSRAASSA